MTLRSATLTRRGFIVASLVAFSFFGYGCGGSSDSATLGAQFAPSATPTGVRVIKLVKKSTSGARVVVQAVVYGPDLTLDMYAFAFDVKIGDTSVVKYVQGSDHADVSGGALGQNVQSVVAADGSDPSHIVVGVTKTSGPPGNNLAGPSAVIVELTFEVKKSGTTTLALTGSTGAPSQPPTVLDSSSPPQPIAGFNFDAATATVTGVSTGGGGY